MLQGRSVRKYQRARCRTTHTNLAKHRIRTKFKKIIKEEDERIKSSRQIGNSNKSKVRTIIKVYQMRTGINVSEKSRIQSVVTARQCLFFILRQKYKMKFATIGWLADKNHATIIHANKNVRSLLDIRDPYTIDSLEQWTSVFKSIFEHSKFPEKGS
jgi:chromosomal replication initiation ATPase DnaA